MAVTFESYERRIDQIKPVMEKYGIKDYFLGHAICSSGYVQRTETELEQFFIKNCSGGRVQADARAVMSLKTAFFKRNEGSEAFKF